MKRPIQFRVHFNGEVLVPDARTLDYCKSELGEGEVITLERNEDRSENSHRHYFACLSEAWSQLPESLMEEYPTVEALRAKALIKTGFYHERNMVCSTVDEARKIAAFIQPFNHYAITDISGNVIRVYTAKSQSRSAMKRTEFQDSKDKVLQFVANLVGVSTETLAKNSGRAI